MRNLPFVTMSLAAVCLMAAGLFMAPPVFAIQLPTGATPIENPTASSPSAASAPRTLQNPLGNTDLNKIIGQVIKGLLGFSGVIALASFVWGGFLFLTSQGNPDRVKKGKDTLIWAVIGLVVIFTAYILVDTLIRTITGATQA